MYNKKCCLVYWSNQSKCFGCKTDFCSFICSIYGRINNLWHSWPLWGQPIHVAGQNVVDWGLVMGLVGDAHCPALATTTSCLLPVWPLQLATALCCPCSEGWVGRWGLTFSCNAPAANHCSGRRREGTLRSCSK